MGGEEGLWLPTDAQTKTHVRSLMRPVLRAGQESPAGSRPPSRGINDKPFDYEYVTSADARSEAGVPVAYVIAEPCIDVMDRSCVESVPSNASTRDPQAYISPVGVIRLGACEPVCRSRRSAGRAVDPDFEAHVADNARFFDDVCRS